MNVKNIKWKLQNIKFRSYCWLSRQLGYKVINVTANKTRGIGKTEYLHDLANKNNAILIEGYENNVDYVLKNFDEKYNTYKRKASFISSETFIFAKFLFNGDIRRSDVRVVNGNVVVKSGKLRGMNRDDFIIIDEGVGRDDLREIINYYGWDRVIMCFV